MELTDVTVDELEKDVTGYIGRTINNSDFWRVKTKAGNAVIISEEEWEILRDGLQVLLTMQKK